MALIFADPVGAYYSTAVQAAQGLWSVFSGGTLVNSGLPAGNIEATAVSNLNTGTIALPTPGAGPWTFGCRLAWTGAGVGVRNIVKFQDSTNTEQIHLSVDTNVGSLAVTNGSGTVLGTSAVGVLAANVWAFIEIQALIHASAGTVEVRVNGIAVLTLSGKNTKGGATVNTDKLVLGLGGTPQNYLQDVYALDSTGSYNNTFLGDVRMSVYNAAGAGTAGLNQYTAVGAPTVWQAVADATPDDDSTYASDATPTDRMSVTYAASSVSGTVVAVQHVTRMRKDDVGTRTAEQITRSNGVDVAGPSISLGTTYRYYQQILETDPNTGLPWTVANFNLIEAGVETLT